MNKRKTTLIVGTMAMCLALGTTGIVMSSSTLKGTTSATSEPLVLDVVTDNVRNGDAKTVVTSKGTTLAVDSKLEDNASMPGWYKLRSFANLDRIGNIHGLDMEFNGGPSPAAFKISWGYESGEDGMPIYVKEGYILPEDAKTPKKLDFRFSSIIGVANPNFVKIELRQANWAAAPIKTLKVIYGNKAGVGDAACTASATPLQFLDKAFIDYTDPLVADDKLVMDTKYDQGNPDSSKFGIELQNLKAGTKFQVKLADKVATIGDISLLSEFLEKDSNNVVTVKKAIEGKTTVTLIGNSDGTLNVSFEIKGKVYVPKEFYIFGTRIQNSEFQYWSNCTIGAVYNNDKTYTFPGLVCVGGNPDSEATQFVVKTKADSNYEIPCDLYETAPEVAFVAGSSHIIIQTPGTYDIIVNDSAEKLSVKIVAHVAA